MQAQSESFILNEQSSQLLLRKSLGYESEICLETDGAKGANYNYQVSNPTPTQSLGLYRNFLPQNLR